MTTMTSSFITSTVAMASVEPVSWDDEREWKQLIPERIVRWQTLGARETQELFIGRQFTQTAAWRAHYH